MLVHFFGRIFVCSVMHKGLLCNLVFPVYRFFECGTAIVLQTMPVSVLLLFSLREL